MTSKYLCPRLAHLHKSLIDYLHKSLETFVLVAEIFSKNNGTDVTGQVAAQGEGIKYEHS